MRSHKNERFDQAFDKLPDTIQRQAREAYRLFTQNPYHPGLRFKQVHPTDPIYSVRITDDYRALGRREGEDIIWFWIGPHAEYDQLIARR
jgi:hypothetical protein